MAGAMPEPGQKVRVKAGPFRNFIGKVATVDGARQKVHVELSFFTRPMIVELDYTDIEPV